METDEQLLERFLAGEESAFELLVDRHEAAIRNLAHGFLRDRGLAEDVAQEAFIRAYRKARSFKGHGSFRAWLYSIAVRCAQDEIRRRKRKSEVPWDERETADPAASVEERLAAREQQRRLAQAMKRLRDEYRAPLLLREVEGLSYREIAEVLGWPLGTVETRIHRGRKELRELLALPTRAPGGRAAGWGGREEEHEL